MANYRILVINLDRSPERLAAISAQLEKLDVPFERVVALDGKEPVSYTHLTLPTTPY